MEFTNDIQVYLTNAVKAQGANDTTMEKYASMKYPRCIPMMRFNTNQYHLDGFGTVMIMSTKAMGGMMKLLTVSFTPSEGKQLPYLLIDCMEMSNKALAYVEYYDCTGEKLSFSLLDKLASKYSEIPDYNEKPAWYVDERMSCSLIKGGKGVDPKMLLDMIKESIDAYLSLIDASSISDANQCISGLREFQQRMVKEGNPSQPTMRKVLGEEGADLFFTEYVMPV